MLPFLPLCFISVSLTKPYQGFDVKLNHEKLMPSFHPLGWGELEREDTLKGICQTDQPRVSSKRYRVQGLHKDLDIAKKKEEEGVEAGRT